MLIFLVSAGHGYTIDRLRQPDVRERGLDVLARSYESAFVQTALPRSTYLFTDFERMYPWELLLAARLYRASRAQGGRLRLQDCLRMARTLHA